MRARIPHCESFSLRRAPQHERNLEQHCFGQFLARYFVAAQRRIPEIPQKTRAIVALAGNLQFVNPFALLRSYSDQIVVHISLRIKRRAGSFRF